MDERKIELIKGLTDKLEEFLKACKNEGDATIDDVLNAPPSHSHFVPAP
ncbi:MAG: hypothetical protein KAX15_03460 [Candidatus Omnitrophica bacterium]|nr:hypothetical protein [Candidatus Omnitrophota bacterium]